MAAARSESEDPGPVVEFTSHNGNAKALAPAWQPQLKCNTSPQMKIELLVVTESGKRQIIHKRAVVALHWIWILYIAQAQVIQVC